MKKLACLFVGALTALCACLNAAEVTLAWDANPEPDISHYTVYTRAGEVVTQTTPIPTNIVRLVDIPEGVPLEFWVTASNEYGESRPSESVLYTAPLTPAPEPPQGLASPTLVSSWQKVTNSSGVFWVASAKWQPVTNATSYVFTIERETASGLSVMARSTTGTYLNLLLEHAPTRIYVQSANATGLSPKDTFTASPGPPSAPTGLTIP